MQANIVTCLGLHIVNSIPHVVAEVRHRRNHVLHLILQVIIVVLLNKLSSRLQNQDAMSSLLEVTARLHGDRLAFFSLTQLDKVPLLFLFIILKQTV